MRKFWIVSGALCFMSLFLGCSTTPKGEKIASDNTTASQPLSDGQYVSFSKYSAVRDVHGQLWGSWSSSFNAACLGGIPGYIEDGAITKRENAGNCSDGQAIIKVTHN